MGADERTLVPGYVREPGHHGGLLGDQYVMVGHIDDPLAQATNKISNPRA